MQNSAKPKKPQYTFLPKQMKTFVDLATVDGMLKLLDNGCDVEFAVIIGIIADLKNVTGRISEDHEKVLKLPRMLLKAGQHE